MASPLISGARPGRPGRIALSPVAAIVVGYAATVLPVQAVASLQLAGLLREVRFWWLLVAVAASWAAVSRYIALPRFPSIGRIPAHLRISLGIVALTYLVLFLRTFFTYPSGFDLLAYHYPVALRWLQQHSFAIGPETDWRFALPGNVEILAMLLIGIGQERLLSLVGLPAALALVCALYSLLTRRFQASLEVSTAVILIVLSVPMICLQAFSGYVDLFGAAMLFAALDLFLDGGMFPGALACGLALGAKPTFWPLAISLLAWFAIARRQWRFLFAALIPSAFWFARAWAETGNPFFPIAMGHLPGYARDQITSPGFYLDFVRQPADWLVYPWTEWLRTRESLETAYTEGAGLGGAFAALAIPGVFYALWKPRPAVKIAVVALIALLAMWWFVYSRNPRFVLALPIVACLCAAPLIERWERTGNRVYRLLLPAALGFTSLIVATHPAHLIASTLRAGDWTRATALLYPPLIDRLPAGSVILNLSSGNMNFVLAGERHTNQVINDFECPMPLTARFLESRRVEYVFQQWNVPDGIDVPLTAPVPDLVPILRDERPGGPRITSRTMIWRAAIQAAR